MIGKKKEKNVVDCWLGFQPAVWQLPRGQIVFDERWAPRIGEQPQLTSHKL